MPGRHLQRKAICRLQALNGHSKVSSRGSPVLNNCCTTGLLIGVEKAVRLIQFTLLPSPAPCTNDSSRMARVGVKMMTMPSANRNRRFFLLPIQIEFVSKLKQLPSSSAAFLLFYSCSVSS